MTKDDDQNKIKELHELDNSGDEDFPLEEDPFEQYDFVVGVTHIQDEGTLRYDIHNNHDKIEPGDEQSEELMLDNLYSLYNIGLHAKEEADNIMFKRAEEAHRRQKRLLKRIK